MITPSCVPEWTGERRRHRTAALDQGRVGRLGEAEIEHFHGAVRPQFHVGRFQIAMNDALI
jgi:hypothetical protein